MSRSLRFHVFLLGLFTQIATGHAAEPIELPVWRGVAPGSEKHHASETWEERGKNGVVDRAVRQVHQPTITVFLPKKSATPTAAVLVVPGGGFDHVTIDKEGFDVARWLAAHGVAGIVLKYRLPETPGNSYSIDTALADMREALQVIRAQATDWGIDGNKLGLLGFSAGGQVAALAATRTPHATHPAFLGLIYPRLPENPAVSPANLAPTFIIQASDDRVVSTDDTLRFYQQLRAQKVAVELHLFATGGHGFGLGKSGSPSAQWPQLFLVWLSANGVSLAR